MDAIASIPLIGGPIATVLSFVAVLGIVVFVHEFGHYIVARWCGIRSEVFSIGFGPVLWSRHDRRAGRCGRSRRCRSAATCASSATPDGASRADLKSLRRLPASERCAAAREILAADADGAGGAGLQLPRRSWSLPGSRCGRACRPSGRPSARSPRCPVSSSRSGRATSCCRSTARRSRPSRSSTPQRRRCRAPRPMPVRVERDGATST